MQSCKTPAIPLCLRVHTDAIDDKRSTPDQTPPSQLSLEPDSAIFHSPIDCVEHLLFVSVVLGADRRNIKVRFNLNLEVIAPIVAPNCTKWTRAVVYELGTGVTYGCFDIF